MKMTTNGPSLQEIIQIGRQQYGDGQERQLKRWREAEEEVLMQWQQERERQELEIQQHEQEEEKEEEQQQHEEVEFQEQEEEENQERQIIQSYIPRLTPLKEDARTQQQHSYIPKYQNDQQQQQERDEQIDMRYYQQADTHPDRPIKQIEITKEVQSLEAPQRAFLQWKQLQMDEINKRVLEARSLMAKERKLWEKQKKAAEILPSRGGRVEVSILQQQLKDAKTDVTKWESKYNLNMERLRKDLLKANQRNNALQDEIKSLQTTIIKQQGLETVGQISANSPRSPSQPKPRRPALKQVDSSPNSQKLVKRTPKAEVESLRCQSADTENASPNLGRTERRYEDGTVLCIFGNGTTKEVSPDGQTTLNYNNGDIKQISAEGVEVYYFKEAQISQITYNDGLTVYRFANGQVEKHFPEGHKEILFPDGTVKKLKE